jgi:hypothetical protein
MAISAKDRSALLRMAGNIAGGMAANPDISAHASLAGFTPEEQRGFIADCAVDLALKIHADPRLAAESTPQGEAAARGRE